MHFASVARKAALMTMLLVLMEGGGHFFRCEEEAAPHPCLVPPVHSSKDALPSLSANVVKSEQQHLRERVSSIEEQSASLKVADQQLGEIDTGEDPFFTFTVGRTTGTTKHIMVDLLWSLRFELLHTFVTLLRDIARKFQSERCFVDTTSLTCIHVRSVA
jgi:hypothetical protein